MRNSVNQCGNATVILLKSYRKPAVSPLLKRRFNLRFQSKHAQINDDIEGVYWRDKKTFKTYKVKTKYRLVL